MKLKLVNKILEAKDSYSFYFKPDIVFDWQPGQYLVLKIGNDERQLTISSSPTEKIIQITTRLRKGSEFKQALNKLNIGEKIEARGPFGSFVLSNHYSEAESHSLVSNHLFLAGGIGITPFRSFIKYNIDQKNKNPIAKLNLMFLIYSNSGPDFVFKKELDQWQKENDFLKIEFIDTSTVSRIDKLKIAKLIGNWKLETENCIFWSVGPKAFVNSMEDILEELHIPQDHIKTEKFIGY